MFIEKQYKIIIIFIGVALVTGCRERGEKVVSSNDIIDYKDRVYEKDSQVPYTGKMVDYYRNSSQKMFENYFHKGLLHGKQFAWFSSGQTYTEAGWRYGRPDSLKKWDKSGSLIIYDPPLNWQKPIDFIFKIDWSSFKFPKSNYTEK